MIRKRKNSLVAFSLVSGHFEHLKDDPLREYPIEQSVHKMPWYPAAQAPRVLLLLPLPRQASSFLHSMKLSDSTELLQ
jgi:hypothetical protein